MLLADSGQEARHVDQRQQRNVEAVASADEASGLRRRVDVERAGEDGRLLCHDADAPATQAREPDDDVRCPTGLDLEEVAVVRDPL